MQKTLLFETGHTAYAAAEKIPKTFMAAFLDKAECQYMKMINLSKVHDSLVHDRYQVKVPENVAKKARKAIDRMLQIC